MIFNNMWNTFLDVTTLIQTSYAKTNYRNYEKSTAKPRLCSTDAENAWPLGRLHPVRIHHSRGDAETFYIRFLFF